MNPDVPIHALLRRLWRHIGPRRQRQFGLLLLLMFLAAFAEVVSLGAVMPLLVVLTAPERIFEHQAAQPLISALGFTQPADLLFPITIAFVAAAILATTIRLLLLWVRTRLSAAVGTELGIGVYRRTLYQPYSVHVAQNSSRIISGISKASGKTASVLSAMLSFISDSVMFLVVLAGLAWIDPVVTLVTIGGFGSAYFLIVRFTRNRLRYNSEVTNRESTQLIKAMQEGLGGIRDVLIDGSQAVYCRIFERANYRLRKAQQNSALIGQIPVQLLETVVIVILAAFAFGLAQQPGRISQAIPVLGVLVLGIRRLMPATQQIYGSWATIQKSSGSLADVLELLDQPLPADADLPPPEPIPFKESLVLEQVGFRYADTLPMVLSHFELTIAKGSRVGFIGTTGSGKSTLLDIVMGLLDPTEGRMLIDGLAIGVGNRRAWQQHIAHVPQAIFLADVSIAENIALGMPAEDIDLDRVRDAAQQAQIADFIESLAKGYKTEVGERGVRLSGGQRQRIGIARALYKHADVIIFDEATSALDNETENAVMQAIHGLSQGLTVLIVAHRVTTLRGCDQIVEIAGGRIHRVGEYREICQSVA